MDSKADLHALVAEMSAHTAREEAFWDMQREANEFNRKQHELIMEKLEARLIAETTLRAEVKNLSQSAAHRGAIIGGIITGSIVAVISFIVKSLRIHS